MKALEPVVGTSTSLILTYPNLTACDPLALKVDLAPWRDVTTVPLPPSSSPMRGWSDSVGLIKTEFALLLRRWSASDLCVAAMAWGGIHRRRDSSTRRALLTLSTRSQNNRRPRRVEEPSTQSRDQLTPRTQTTTATPSTRTSPANWLGRSKLEILRMSWRRRCSTNLNQTAP